MLCKCNIISLTLLFNLYFMWPYKWGGGALCYKLEGRRFKYRMRWIFSIYLILRAALWSWGRLSLSQKWRPGNFRGVKSSRHVGLTTLPPSMSWMSQNVGASNSRNPKGFHGLYRDNFTLPYECIPLCMKQWWCFIIQDILERINCVLSFYYILSI
jgi:hypothetical protein